MLARPGWRMSLHTHKVSNPEIRPMSLTVQFPRLVAARRHVALDGSAPAPPEWPPRNPAMGRFWTADTSKGQCRTRAQIPNLSSCFGVRSGVLAGFVGREGSRGRSGAGCGRGWGTCGGSRDRSTHTTICLRPSRGLRMNLRVRRVTGASESAILAVGWRYLSSTRLTVKECDR